MTGLEFTAAALIAVFAMIGGAVLNAAITAPQNCGKILDQLWPWTRVLPVSAVGIAVLAILRRWYWHETDDLWSDPLIWIAGGEIALFLMLGMADFASGHLHTKADDGSDTNRS